MDSDFDPQVVRILGQGQVTGQRTFGKSARPPADEGGGEHATKTLVPEVTMEKFILGVEIRHPCLFERADLRPVMRSAIVWN